MHIESWNLYFPEEQYTVFNEGVEKIKEIKGKLRLTQEEMVEIERERCFYLEFKDFPQEEKDSEMVLECVSCAISEVLKENGFGIFKVKTRLKGVGDITVDITAENYGRVTSLVGTVCRVGFKKILLPKAFFECSKCHEVISVEIQENIFQQPKKCKGTCKSKGFVFLFHHPSTIMRDVQEIKIQKLDSPGEPVDCLIYDDFVGRISPGDVLRVCGTINAENESNSLYKLIVKINNFEYLKDHGREKLNDVNNFSESFRSIVRNVSQSDTKNILSTLTTSLFPDIFGHDLIKVGLLLSLFGGTRKYVGQSQIRAEIHTLIVGDPGLGKSRMLLASSSILPKSIYVSGNLTTTAGLTVSLTHDPTTGDFMADAGALVVADNGICCLDEFDKIDDHSALFEAMEEQKVTVAKGGVVCSIPTRPTIIAASNPKYGHFNRSKSIRENLRFDNALLSRFDLIFILVDDLNEKENYEISDQILKRRHLSSSASMSLYPMDVVRNYLNYARASVHPVLSTSAKEEIKKFYLEIRKKSSITTRDLESLIRLTEARAKVDLRTIATREDASFCINLYKSLLEKDTKKKKTLKDLFEELKSQETTTFTRQEILDLIKAYELNKPPEEILEILNYRGVILKRGQNEYKVVQ